MNLGSRLQTIANFVISDKIFADIGTDHAYLPIYLVKNGIIKKAIAGDYNKGPYEAAKKAVLNYNLTQNIDVRLGNGLAVLSEGEADIVAIAGMGGSTIIEILGTNVKLTQKIQRLILQPMNNSQGLRRWLNQNSFKIVAEELVVDEGKLYEIIVAELGKENIAEEIFYEIGPRLWEQKHYLLEEHLNKLVDKTKNIYESLCQSNKDNVVDKIKMYETKIKDLEDKLQCLLNAKF